MNQNVEEEIKDCKELLKNEHLRSPVVLKESIVVEGIGQMLVLAVGKNSFKYRNQITKQKHIRKKSILQIKLDEFFKNVKNFALIISFIIVLINGNNSFSDDWNIKMKTLYHQDSSSPHIWSLLIELLSTAIFLLTAIVVFIPDGLRVAADVASALSVQNLIENGILVKDVSALESIGSLDRVVFDFTRGFTLNQINFQSCVINDRI